MYLRVNHIIKDTKVEGPSNRYCIYVQGCLKHCYKCNSPQTWDLNDAKSYEVKQLSGDILNSGVDGVTYSGGEPLLQSRALYELSLLLKEKNLSIVLFTGYTYELIKKVNCANWNNLISLVDMLITEPFIYEMRTTDKLWVGSSNQKHHFLSSRYQEYENKMDNMKNQIEIRLSKDGLITVNGMADNEEIKRIFDKITGE